MENWRNINNDLIKQVETRTGKKNSLKTQIRIYPQGDKSGSYSKEFRFQIPRQYDNLSQIVCRMDLTFGVAAVETDVYLAARVFKSIQLRTRRDGRILQTLTPNYITSRIDELYGTPLYSQISRSVSLGIGATSATLYLPFFLFFSEDHMFLQTRKLQDLEIVCITSDDIESMGVSQELSTLTPSLYLTYYDTDKSNKFDDQLYTSKKEVINKIWGYNIFVEDDNSISLGATSSKMLLRCDRPLFALHLSVFDNTTQIRKEITNVKIWFGSKLHIDIPTTINYELCCNRDGYLQSGVFIYWFSRDKSRLFEEADLIVFSDPMFPVYVEVEFSATNTAYYILRPICEYITTFNVSDKGDISEEVYLNQPRPHSVI